MRTQPVLHTSRCAADQPNLLRPHPIPPAHAHQAALPANPAEDSVSNVVLGALVNIQNLPGFAGILDSFSVEADAWRQWATSDTPQDLPAPMRDMRLML